MKNRYIKNSRITEAKAWPYKKINPPQSTFYKRDFASGATGAPPQGVWFLATRGMQRPIRLCLRCNRWVLRTANSSIWFLAMRSD